MVCNASNRAAVVARFEEVRGTFDCTLDDETTATVMIAVQGPSSTDVLGRVVESGEPLMASKYYHCTPVRILGGDGLASRTGYTGEDGFELILPRDQAEAVWTALLEAGHGQGIRPCGLGARDTLRFEAAMPLYGHELSGSINPYEAGLGWAVKLNKGEFVGRDALRRLKGQPARRRVGLALDGKRIARQGYAVHRDGHPVGHVTSGTFAPTLKRSLAMALVEPGLRDDRHPAGGGRPRPARTRRGRPVAVLPTRPAPLRVVEERRLTIGRVAAPRSWERRPGCVGPWPEGERP